MMVRYAALARTVSLALCFLTISCKTTTGDYRSKARVGTSESAGQSPIDNPVLESLPSENMDGASRNGDQKSAPGPGSEGATAGMNVSSYGVGLTSACLAERTGEVTCWGGRMLTDEPSSGFGSDKISQGVQRPSFMVAGSHRCAGVFQFVNVAQAMKITLPRPALSVVVNLPV